MINTTISEIVEFINSMPDDAPIKMVENIDEESCVGCLMVQFARHKGLKNTACSFVEWFISDKVDCSIKLVMKITDGDLFDLVPQEPDQRGFYRWPKNLTYRKLKDYIRKRNENSVPKISN